MPYAKMSDVNPAIKGIKPPVTLAQANKIAEWADKIEGADNPWAVAISQFKKLYEKKDDGWVKKKAESADDGPNDEGEESQPVGDLEEAGKRLNRSQIKRLQGALEVIQDTLSWANYDDVVPEVEEEVSEFAESASGRAMKLVEVDQAEVVPLHLEVALIEPGFGNKRDNHYYPRNVLERDAGVFEGTKMYESDHGPKNTRLWVSTVKEIKGFTESGAPIGLVSVHDPGFATRIMALEADDLLGKMECSILANGKAKKGKIDGKKTKIVEAITEADSVDWVTRAGCGGRALSLSESEEENMSEKPEDTNIDEGGEESENTELSEGDEGPQENLEADVVEEALGKTNLPDASKARLSEADYQSEDDLSDAIKVEVAYVKELTGSGKPFGQGSAEPGEKPRKEILKEKNERHNEIMRTVGLEV